MSTTVERLGQQHQEVLARLAAVEREPPAGSGTSLLADFVDFLEREVMEHFVVEEQALFPVLERHIGRTEGPLAVMDMEHATFRGLLQDLAAGLRSEDPARCRQRAHAIIDLLRDHIAKEDHVLFPMASRLLSAEEHAEVDARADAINPSAATA